jgi:hypothetical protein
MTPRQPVTTRRLLIVMAPTVAACTATALFLGPGYPFAALLFTAGILCMSSAALPAPAWSWWLRAAGRMIPRRVKRWARFSVSWILGEPYGPRPERGAAALRRQWHERLYFHLGKAEWDSRVKLGVSLWHRERVAIGAVPPGLQRLEDWLWPECEWMDVVEDVWREDERRRGQ